MRGTLHNKNQTINPNIARYPRAKPTEEKDTVSLPSARQILLTTAFPTEIVADLKQKGPLP